MDEADGILIGALRGAGCAVPEETDSLKDMEATTWFTIVHTALQAVAGEAIVPASLPANVAARHRAGGALGRKIKALGYRGDAGYNQVLYPSYADVRTLAGFLVSKLPAPADAADGEADEAPPAGALLEREIARAVGAWTKTPWVAPRAASAPALPLHTRPLCRPFPGPSAPPPRRVYMAGQQPLVSAQAPSIPSLLVSLSETAAASGELQRLADADTEAAGMEGVSSLFTGRRAALSAHLRAAFASGGAGAGTSSGGFGMGAGVSLEALAGRIRAAAAGSALSGLQARAAMTQEKTTVAEEAVAAPDKGEGKSDEEVAAERAAELTALSDRLRAVEAETAALQVAAADTEAGAVQLRGSLAAAVAEASGLEDKLRAAKATLALVPQAATIIPKLQGDCAAVADRLVDLAAQWELRRRPLLEGIRQYKLALAKRRARCEEMVGEMSTLRGEMSGLGGDIKAREGTVAQLSAELESLPTEHNRNEYTKRIMEIVREVRKQQGEIGKVIAEITALQRAAGMTADKLGRTTATTEATIFQVAQVPGKTQTTAIEAYRNLTMMQELFHTLRSVVADIASAENEERDVQTRIDDLKRHVDPARTAQVKADLTAVRGENAQLSAALAATGAGAAPA